MSNIITLKFCDHYIEKLADYIEAEYISKGKDLKRLAIVFGGRRPSLFLKKQLASRIKTSFYSPHFFKIDEFFSYIVDHTQTVGPLQDLDSCYLLYSIAKRETPILLQGRERFADFLPWAQEICGFIDQLDLEHISSDSLEKIKEHAQIGFAIPDDINILLKNIIVLREAYKDMLLKKDIFSRGLLYRYASEIIGKKDLDEFDDILFCNFFYFNQSEYEVVRSLYNRGKAKFIFQGDQRKWSVLEKLSKKFDYEIKEGENVEEPRFDLKIYEAFDVHSQVSTVREILKGIKNLDQTVVVLPNPDNIIPLISEVVHIAEEFNISLGYPLKRSSLFSLFESIFRVQLSRKNQAYYARDYLRLLQHPFVKNLNIFSDPKQMRMMVNRIEEVLIGKIIGDVSGSLFCEIDRILESDDIFSREILIDEKQENIDDQLSRIKEGLNVLHKILLNNWENIIKFI